MITTQQLQLVAAIVRTGSVAKAATALGISGPAASRTLGALERRLGVSLFDRVGRGIRPTRFGSEFARVAGTITAATDGLERRARQVARGLEGDVIIGSGPIPLVNLLPEAIIRLLQVAPKVRVEATTGQLPDLLKGLRELRFDMIVADPTGFGPEVDLEGLEYRPLPAMPVAVLCRPGHPLLERAQVGVADLLDFPWVLPSLAAQYAMELGRALAGLPPDRLADLSRRLAQQPQIRMADFHGCLRVAARTDCLTGAPPGLASEYLEAGRLTVVPLPIKLRTGLKVIWDPALPLSEAAERLLGHMMQIASERADPE